MTPQEQELVNELFDRLAKLESNPRHPDAERLIADGLRRAPHAVYALVQTALIQDEALKRANARIEELQAQIGGEERQRSGGFLDSMRDAVLGRRDPALANRVTSREVRRQVVGRGNARQPMGAMQPEIFSHQLRITGLVARDHFDRPTRLAADTRPHLLDQLE